MLKKAITYTDYNGVERTEEFYFNLTETELVEMEMLAHGGMQELLTNIIKAKDSAQILRYFKEIIHRSYGVKSQDGRRLIKNKEVLDEFLQTEAYNNLFMELATDDKAAAEFVNGIIPQKVQAQIAAEQANNPMIAPIA